jgi:hypothetical protein
MRVGVILFLLSCWLVTNTLVASAEGQKTEGSKGITVDDLGRGLKSAAQNVEKEIPKIGSAIGRTVKKITGKDSDKPAENSSKDKK